MRHSDFHTCGFIMIELMISLFILTSAIIMTSQFAKKISNEIFLAQTLLKEITLATSYIATFKNTQQTSKDQDSKLSSANIQSSLFTDPLTATLVQKIEFSNSKQEQSLHKKLLLVDFKCKEST